MRTQISTRATDLTEDLRHRAEQLAADLGRRQPDLRFAKFVLERKDLIHAIGLVMAFTQGDTIVRHAEANDWDRAFLDLERKLERVLEEDGGR
jgi:ribosome-associated translation inhibitor RaiA